MIATTRRVVTNGRLLDVSDRKAEAFLDASSTLACALIFRLHFNHASTYDVISIAAISLELQRVPSVARCLPHNRPTIRLST
jgi:hypothetical protein